MCSGEVTAFDSGTRFQVLGHRVVQRSKNIDMSDLAFAGSGALGLVNAQKNTLEPKSQTLNQMSYSLKS